MSQEENKEVVENTSFINSVFGGEEPEGDSLHSREQDAEEAAEENSSAGDEELLPDDEDAEGIFEDSDSGNDTLEGKKKEEVSAKTEEDDKDSAALKQEIEALQKRLHDTQSAFHKATGERAALKKELDELKTRQENEDDWFSEEDSERKAKLEEDLKKSEAEIARVQEEEKALTRKNAEAQWDEAARPVMKEHPDFEDVLYGKLVPLLDPEKGNPQIRAAWDALEDKSPASQYAFAKNMLDILEFQQDPAAYKAKLREEFNKKHDSGNSDEREAPEGKDGLDMLNSADMPHATSSGRVGSFVDAVFG